MAALMQTAKDSAALQRRLEGDLAAATANNIRESQRQAMMDLGTFFYDRGDFAAASKQFMRSRDRCSSARDTLAFCAAIVKTYAQLGNWPMVATYVSKAEAASAAAAAGGKGAASAAAGGGAADGARAAMAACAGLADMATGRYGVAAAHFAAVGPALGPDFADVVTGADVARYGALCALAARERGWIRREMLGNATFAMHLESSPEARRSLITDCFGGCPVDLWRLAVVVSRSGADN
jgi:COP9 signalosome complex subunit 1